MGSLTVNIRDGSGGDEGRQKASETPRFCLLFMGLFVFFQVSDTLGET